MCRGRACLFHQRYQNHLENASNPRKKAVPQQLRMENKINGDVIRFFALLKRLGVILSAAKNLVVSER